MDSRISYLILILALLGLAPSGVICAKPEGQDFVSVPVTLTNHAQTRAQFGVADLSAESTMRLRMHIFNVVRAHLPKVHAGLAAPLTREILIAAHRFELDPALIVAVIHHESHFRPHVLGGHGEIGLMQIKPSTAAWVAKKYKIENFSARRLYDPLWNVRVGSAYLHHLKERFNDQPRYYLSAFNMGTRQVLRLKRQQIRPAVYYTKVRELYRMNALSTHRDQHFSLRLSQRLSAL